MNSFIQITEQGTRRMIRVRDIREVREGPAGKAILRLGHDPPDELLVDETYDSVAEAITKATDWTIASSVAPTLS